MAPAPANLVHTAPQFLRGTMMAMPMPMIMPSPDRELPVCGWARG
jgi:hypothetical protein